MFLQTHTIISFLNTKRLRVKSIYLPRWWLVENHGWSDCRLTCWANQEFPSPSLAPSPPSPSCIYLSVCPKLAGSLFAHSINSLATAWLVSMDRASPLQRCVYIPFIELGFWGSRNFSLRILPRCIRISLREVV